MVTSRYDPMFFNNKIELLFSTTFVDQLYLGVCWDIGAVLALCLPAWFVNRLM